MKKIISLLMVLVIAMMLNLGAVTASAASGSASLSGPEKVYAGDTITVLYNVKGSGLFGASGQISYDSKQLKLVSKTQSISAPWAVEFNGNDFVAYDNNLSSPIESQKTLFKLTFTVLSTVTEGESIKVSCSGDVSDGNADVMVSAACSFTVAPPLSSNNKLSELTVSNATITPSFSPDKTSYSADVEFDISKLKVTAKAEDEKAKVSVYSPTLKADGKTNVSVTVTAENGSKKVYTISVHRAKDPNYVPSDNNLLNGITVDGFLLSPVFSPQTTKYVVWLPFETDSIKVSGKAADSLASVKTVGGSKLLAGQDNEIKVICTAENGKTKEYIIIAKRAAGHDETVEQKVETDTQKEQVKNTERDDGGNKTNILFVIIALVVGFALGFVADRLLRSKYCKK